MIFAITIQILIIHPFQISISIVKDSVIIFKHLFVRFLLVVKNPLYRSDLISSAIKAHPSSLAIAITTQFFSNPEPVKSIISTFDKFTPWAKPFPPIKWVFFDNGEIVAYCSATELKLLFL